MMDKSLTFVPPTAVLLLEKYYMEGLRFYEEEYGPDSIEVREYIQDTVEQMVWFGVVRTTSTAKTWIRAVRRGAYRTSSPAPHKCTPDIGEEELNRRWAALLVRADEIVAMFRPRLEEWKRTVLAYRNAQHQS